MPESAAALANNDPPGGSTSARTMSPECGGSFLGTAVLYLRTLDRNSPMDGLEATAEGGELLA
jgi:hypothetical protein